MRRITWEKIFPMLNESTCGGWKDRQKGVRPTRGSVRVDAFARQHREQCGWLAGERAVDERLCLAGGQAEDGVLLCAGQSVFAA